MCQDRKTKAVSWAAPRKVATLDFQSSSIPLPGRRKELGISFWFYGAEPGVGLWSEGVSIFPTHFSVTGFAPAQGAGVSQLVSGFLTKVIHPHVVVESCVHEGKEDPGLNATIWLKSPYSLLLNANVDLLCDGQQMHRKHMNWAKCYQAIQCFSLRPLNQRNWLTIWEGNNFLRKLIKNKRICL